MRKIFAGTRRLLTSSGLPAALSDGTGLSRFAILRNMPPGLDYDRPGAGFGAGPLKSAILCTPRSGSSLVSVALEAYGFRFKEYLNPHGMLADTVAAHGLRKTSTLGAPLAAAMAHEGRISVKTAMAGVPYLFMAGEFPARMGEWRFVHLRRQNLVRQAISLFVAHRTGQWTGVMKATGAVSDADYSFARLHRLVGRIAEEDRQIQRFFGLFGLAPYELIYEDYLRDPPRHLRALAEYFGADPADYPEAATHEPWLKAQATNLNTRWEARFHDDLATRLRQQGMA